MHVMKTKKVTDELEERALPVPNSLEQVPSEKWRKYLSDEKQSLTDRLVFFFTDATTHCGFVFCSLLAEL